MFPAGESDTQLAVCHCKEDLKYHCWNSYFCCFGWQKDSEGTAVKRDCRQGHLSGIVPQGHFLEIWSQLPQLRLAPKSQSDIAQWSSLVNAVNCHSFQWWNDLGEQKELWFQHLEVEIWFHDESVIYLCQTQQPGTGCDTLCSGYLNLLMAQSPGAYMVAGCLDTQVCFLYYCKADHPNQNCKFVGVFGQ